MSSSTIEVTTSFQDDIVKSLKNVSHVHAFSVFKDKIKIDPEFSQTLRQIITDAIESDPSMYQLRVNDLTQSTIRHLNDIELAPEIMSHTYPAGKLRELMAYFYIYIGRLQSRGVLDYAGYCEGIKIIQDVGDSSRIYNYIIDISNYYLSDGLIKLSCLDKF